MRYFFSTGEASGELTATTLARAIARLDPHAHFEGIGSEGMRAAGFSLWHDNAGWASMGPLSAIPRIPKLLAIELWTALRLARRKPDLIILVDFGAFNVRLAKSLRQLGYTGPILDIYPPGTWLDRERGARAIAEVAMPLTAFAHQRDFYQSLGLPIAYFGHPLASQYSLRPPRAAPLRDGGAVALLPGSRAGELRYHVPRLFDAYAILKRNRPRLRAIGGAADPKAREYLTRAAAERGVADFTVVSGTLAAIADADAAWVSSGTAVLECALSGVPVVVLYVVSPWLERYAQRVRAGRFIALPNLVMQRRIVPELLQEQATPERLAAEMESVLQDPGSQYAEFTQLRAAIGSDDAVGRSAAFAVELAKKSPSLAG